MPRSRYNSGYPDSHWSNPAYQGSLRTFDTRRELVSVDVDEHAFCTIERNDFLASEYPDLETDVMIQYGPKLTPNNNGDAEKWESPGTIPPDSSLPCPSSTLPMSCCPDVTTGQLLSCQRDGGGQSRVKALFDDDAFIFPTTTPFDHSSSHSPTPKHQTRESPPTWTNMAADMHGQGHLEYTSESSSSKAAAQGPFDERAHAMNGQTRILDKVDEIKRVSTRKGLVPLSRRKALLSSPTVLDLAISNQPEHPSARRTEVDRPRDATVANSEINGKDGVPFKMPSRKVSYPPQATLDGCLKRRRSSIDCPPESKKLKLDRTVSHISCASNTTVEPQYQATEPASIRRARSLRSEVSACSNDQTDPLYYPSPLSSPTSRPCADKDYPPTLPSTPLPTSADYARSKANPLARTIAIYRNRSLNIPSIPPVPIIAPPQDLAPTLVRCAEDHAIDRLGALLLRERSERERDGLNACDEKRAERFKPTSATDSTFPRRDSGSTSDSSDDRGQWEDQSTRSATESQESWDQVPSVNIASEQHQFVTRDIWTNAFGIADDLRKEITRWILKKLPKGPVPSEQSSGDKRHLGIDLYDQLTNSRQTRFHAAQLFHRYFLLPDKVEYWREASKHDRFEPESSEDHEDTNWKQGVWALGVACMALGVKLHRDCLPPLGPVYAAEFIEMAPYAMTHNAFELAQRDILYTFQFLLGSCTPQGVMDELWIALPTLRKATAPIRDGWAVVQRVTWDKLFESLLEPDMLQYPITLLTAAALIEGLISALMGHFKAEAEASVCKCKASPVSESAPSDIEPTSSQIHLFEATELVDDVILDVRDVLQLSDMELDECRKWLSHVGQE